MNWILIFITAAYASSPPRPLDSFKAGQESSEAYRKTCESYAAQLQKLRTSGTGDQLRFNSLSETRKAHQLLRQYPRISSKVHEARRSQDLLLRQNQTRELVLQQPGSLAYLCRPLIFANTFRTLVRSANSYGFSKTEKKEMAESILSILEEQTQGSSIFVELFVSQMVLVDLTSSELVPSKTELRRRIQNFSEQMAKAKSELDSSTLRVQQKRMGSEKGETWQNLAAQSLLQESKRTEELRVAFNKLVKEAKESLLR